MLIITSNTIHTTQTISITSIYSSQTLQTMTVRNDIPAKRFYKIYKIRFYKIIVQQSKIKLV